MLKLNVDGNNCSLQFSTFILLILMKSTGASKQQRRHEQQQRVMKARLWPSKDLRRSMVAGGSLNTGYGAQVNKRLKQLQKQLQLDDGAFKNDLVTIIGSN